MAIGASATFQRKIHRYLNIITPLNIMDQSIHHIQLDFEQAKTRHLLFKTKIKSFLYGADIEVNDILSPTESPLGKWLYIHCLKTYGVLSETHDLICIHEKLYVITHDLIEQYNNGKIVQARSGSREMEYISDEFISVINSLEEKAIQSKDLISADIESKIQVNFQELIELNTLIRDLEYRIKIQTDDLNLTKKRVELRLRSHFSQAPVAICILRGEDFIVELANTLYLELVDKTEDFIGKPLFISLPELEGQGIREMLNGVLTSGNPFIGNEIEVILTRNHKKEKTYFNFVYKSLEDDGVIPGIMVVCSEVTAHVLSQQTFHENQRKLNIAIESAALGTYEYNIKTEVITFSDRYLEIFNFQKHEHPTHAEMIDRIHPDDLMIRIKAHELALKTGVLSYQLRIIQKNTNIHWVKAMGKVFYDVLGNPEKIMGTVMDITESKTAEEKIKKANESLEIAMNASNLGSYELNLITNESNFNATSKKHFGFDLNQPVTIDDIRNSTHPDDLETLRSSMQHALEHKEKFVSEYRIIRKSNEIRWISSSGKGMYDASNVLIKIVGVIEDITQRKEIEEILNLSLEKFRLLANSMPQFVWTSDAAGNLDYFNLSVFDYSGLSPATIYSEGWLQIVHPDDQKNNIDKWLHSVQTGEDFLCEHRFKKHTGEYRWQLSRAIPQRNKLGNIQMWVGTSTDIQDQKTMAQYLENLVLERTKELKNANKELDNMNQELQSFTYISSHDLQEPLRKIQTFVSRIQDSDGSTLSKDGLNYFNKIQLSAHKMKTLINDLLTYSKTSSSEKTFEKANLNLILNEIKVEFTDTLLDKNGTLEISGLPEINANIFQMRQLFINLISNALKFTKHNTAPVINISSTLILGKDIGNTHAHENELYHQIIVKDNGIGFDSDYKNKIFEVFQRLHSKTEFEGTGIGLSICNKIALNHNGFITADGIINQGATFKIYLPVTN